MSITGSNIDLEELRDDVIKAREELGITQKDLAREANVTRDCVQALEAGSSKKMNRSTCKKLCDALGLDALNYMDELPKPKEKKAPAEEPEPVQPEPVTPEPKKPRPKWGVVPDIKPEQKKNEPSPEVQLLNKTDEVKELRSALDRKCVQYQEVERRANGLQAQLDDDDRLILYLLNFLGRLVGGDVRIP